MVLHISLCLNARRGSAARRGRFARPATATAAPSCRSCRRAGRPTSRSHTNDVTEPVCPRSSNRSCPEARSHTRMTLSLPPTASSPSEQNSSARILAGRSGSVASGSSGGGVPESDAPLVAARGEPLAVRRVGQRPNAPAGGPSGLAPAWRRRRSRRGWCPGVRRRRGGIRRARRPSPRCPRPARRAPLALAPTWCRSDESSLPNPAAATSRPSGLNARVWTTWPGVAIEANGLSSSVRHSRTRRSSPAVATSRPSWLNATPRTQSPCPVKQAEHQPLLGVPDAHQVVVAAGGHPGSGGRQGDVRDDRHLVRQLLGAQVDHLDG